MCNFPTFGRPLGNGFLDGFWVEAHPASDSQARDATRKRLGLEPIDWQFQGK
jgi:hypothetical protein